MDIIWRLTSMCHLTRRLSPNRFVTWGADIGKPSPSVFRLLLVASTCLLFGKQGLAFDVVPLDPTPWVPAGVSIGTPIKDASAPLLAAGYQKSNSCIFKKQLPPPNQDMPAIIALRTSGDCKPEKPIIGLSYSILVMLTIGPSIDFPALIADYNKKIGKEAVCERLDKKNAQCVWNDPPALPKVGSISIRATDANFYMVSKGK